MHFDFFSFPMTTVVRPLCDDDQADLFGNHLPMMTKPPTPPPAIVWQPIDKNTPHDEDILVAQKGTRRRAIARWAPEVAAPSCGGWWLMLSGATWLPTHWAHMPSPLLALAVSGCFMCLFRA